MDLTSPASESPTAGHQTILVIEDDPTIAEILQLLLEDLGCEIIRAATGQQAFELARSQRPDLITLDLLLPDGRDLVMELGSDAELAAIPIIVVSGRAYEPRPESNVVGALLKPFDATELENLVRRALQAPTGLAS
ncbi:MAG: adenylate cyclase [Chloroflexi bacterium]|nr:adenylate cyclase [Chloroflexota bacterium]